MTPLYTRASALLRRMQFAEPMSRDRLTTAEKNELSNQLAWLRARCEEASNLFFAIDEKRGVSGFTNPSFDMAARAVENAMNQIANAVQAVKAIKTSV